VVHQCHLLWPVLVAVQPVAGVVFALDGVLIGAGDVAFMRTLTLVALAGVWAPLAIASLQWRWGITGVWIGLAASILVRLVGMLTRTAGDGWVRLGTG
jgi:Na+-driven multidrug efflux pump